MPYNENKKATDIITTPTPATTTGTVATTTTTAIATTAATTTAVAAAKHRERIENATGGLPFLCFDLLYNRVLPGPRGKENALTICDYITSMKSEINPSDRYKRYW
jgi:hypothetical protein